MEEEEAGFQPAGSVSGDHPSQAGTERVSNSVSSFPIRPTTYLPICPLEGSNGEDGPRPVSVSAELAAALGERPLEEAPDMTDEVEPAAARKPRKAPSPDDSTDDEVEAHKLSGHACFRS